MRFNSLSRCWSADVLNNESLCERDKETKRASIQNLLTDQTHVLVYYCTFFILHGCRHPNEIMKWYEGILMGIITLELFSWLCSKACILCLRDPDTSFTQTAFIPATLPAVSVLRETHQAASSPESLESFVWQKQQENHFAVPRPLTLICMTSIYLSLMSVSHLKHSVPCHKYKVYMENVRHHFETLTGIWGKKLFCDPYFCLLVDLYCQLIFILPVISFNQIANVGNVHLGELCKNVYLYVATLCV